MTDAELAAKYGLDESSDTDARIASKYGLESNPSMQAVIGANGYSKEELQSMARSGLYGARNSATLGFYNTPEEAAAKRENPYSYAGGQIIGGLALAPVGGAVGRAIELPAMVGKTARSTLGALSINTGIGAAQGYNATDENGLPYPEDVRQSNAIRGGGYGAIMSGTGSAVGKVADYAGSKVGQLMPNANNVLRVTAGQANDIYNSTRIAAINRAEQMYPGIAAKVYSNGKGGITTNQKQITDNIKNLSDKEQSVIRANHETALNDHPLAQGASNPNDIQRNLVDLNQQSPVFNNSGMRAGAEAGVGAVGAAVGQWGYNKATDSSGGYGTTVLGALGVPSLMRATGGRVAGPITRYIAQKEANLASLNRINTAPTSQVANRGISAFTGKPFRQAVQGAIPGTAPYVASAGYQQPQTQQDLPDDDEAIAAKYGL